MKHRTIDLSERANLTQVAYLLTRAQLVITNDSGLMHLSSYLDAPVVAVFGHTNPKEYGPWGSESFFVKKEATRKQEQDPTFDHMERISPEDVIAEALRKTQWAPIRNAKV
jgi:ADP-heptose:LPS heptosyltransferase